MKSGIFQNASSSTIPDIVETLVDKGGRTVETTDELTNAVTDSTFDSQDDLLSNTEKQVNLGYTSANSSTVSGNITTSYVYDGDGNVSATYAPGVAPTFDVYDSSDRVVQEIVDAPHGEETDYTYDAMGEQVQSVERRWDFQPSTGQFGSVPDVFTTTDQYDVFGELTDTREDSATTTDPLRETKYQYDVAGNPTEEDEIDDSSNTTKDDTQTVDDALGRTVQQTNTDGSVLTMAYDMAGNETSETLTKAAVMDGSTVIVPAVNRRTEYVYDGLGRVRETKLDTFDGTNFVTQQTDSTDYVEANGKTIVTDTVTGLTTGTVETTTTTVDSAGNTEKVVLPQPDGATTAPETDYSYAYTPSNGTVDVTMKDPSGITTRTTENVDGMTLANYDGNGALVAKDGYDSAERVIREADASGNFETDIYGDPATGLPTETIDADQNALPGTSPKAGTNDVYDSSGDAVDVVDSDGNATKSFYDGEGRLVEQTKVQGGTTLSQTWVYDDFTSTFTDWNGNVTVTNSDPTTDTTVETWFDQGNPTATRRITSISDAAGDLISVTDVANPDSGSPVTMSSWSATYDDLGRMTNSSESFHIGPISGGSTSPTQNFAYTYTANSLLQSSALTLGTNPSPTETTAYTYDGENRPTAVTQTANSHVLQASFGYLPDDRLGTITRSTGATAGSLGTVTTAQFAYQTDGQLQSLTHVDALGTTTLSSFTFGYDLNHRVTAKTYASGGVSDARTYTYDPDGQLTSVTINNVLANSYQYDANGNSAAANTSIGSNNELLDDGTYTYAYDNNGQLISRTADASGPGIVPYTEYQYDNRGRLVSETQKTGVTGILINQVVFNYDAFNRLVGESATVYDSSGNPMQSTSTGFIYDGDNIVARVDGLGNVTRTNLWGPGANQLLASDMIVSGSAVTVWPLFDEEGTIRDLYLFNGSSYQIGQSQSFDEFGKPAMPTTTNSSPAITNFGTYYAGHQLDAFTGQYYADARWYDPTTHQFTTPDPTGLGAGDPNLYRYVGNDPTDMVDPSGMAGEDSTATTNFQRIPVDRVKGLVQDGLAQEYAGYVYLADVAPGGGISVMILEPNVESNYDQVKQHGGRVYQDDLKYTTTSYRVVKYSVFPAVSATALSAMRSAEDAQLNINGVISQGESDSAQEFAGTVVFAYHALPFGAAFDEAAQGNYGEAAISLAGDAAFFLSGPLAGAAKAAGAVRAAKVIRLTAAGIEGGIAATRATQGVFALREGNNLQAAGYFGEATLRLLGMSKDVIQALRGSKARLPTNNYEPGCFPAGTMVATRDESKPIEAVTTGDKVWAFDHITDTWVLSDVLQTFVHDYHGDVVTMTVAGEQITATGNHPFWLADREGRRNHYVTQEVGDDVANWTRGRWVEARELQLGDVLSVRCGQLVPVTELSTVTTQMRVFNFHVAKYNTYAVGPLGALVHNKAQRYAPDYHGPKSTYTNPGTHVPGHPQYVAGKTPLPADAEATYRRAIPDTHATNRTDQTWYGRSAETGEFYRYQGTNGEVHFNAKFEWKDLPVYVQQRFRDIGIKR